MKGSCKPGTRCVNAEAAAASSWEMVRALATQQLRSERDGGGTAVTRLLTRAKFIKIQEVSSSSVSKELGTFICIKRRSSLGSYYCKLPKKFAF